MKSEKYSKKAENSKSEYRKTLEKSKKSYEKFKKSLELYICNLVDFEYNSLWSDDTIKDIIIKHYWKYPAYAPDIINSKTYVLNTLEELSYKGKINLICIPIENGYKHYFMSKKTNITTTNLPRSRIITIVD
tara:strand:- start:52 stop:447 length:396 start_codon:yes stop_codon:yes gene_type:complete